MSVTHVYSIQQIHIVVAKENYFFIIYKMYGMKLLQDFFITFEFSEVYTSNLIIIAIFCNY